MRMLDEGGIAPVPGSSDRAYEFSGFPGLAMSMTTGRAVKLLDAILREDDGWRLPPAPSWRFVWMDRNPVEQARSMRKFLEQIVLGERLPARTVKNLAGSYMRDRERTLALYAERGPVYVASFEDVLADPDGQASRLAEWLAPDLSLDVKTAAAAVHRRPGKCRPDLHYERTGEVA